MQAQHFYLRGHTRLHQLQRLIAQTLPLLNNFGGNPLFIQSKSRDASPKVCKFSSGR
jgi:hypothetical protein